MSQNGSPPPEFEFDEDYRYFMVRLPVHPEARAASAAVAKATEDVGTESALSRHQVEILHKCTEDTPIGDLMSIARRADRTKFRNQILSPLLRAELLQMTIPEKPNSRLQKYHLTQKGHMLVQLVADLLPQRIEQELHTFPPRKLCRWHEITVTRHENQRIDLMLKGHAGDIQTNTHIHPFLTKPEVHVTLTDFSPSRNELLQFACTGFTECR